MLAARTLDNGYCDDTILNDVLTRLLRSLKPRTIRNGSVREAYGEPRDLTIPETSHPEGSS